MDLPAVRARGAPVLRGMPGLCGAGKSRCTAGTSRGPISSAEPAGRPSSRLRSAGLCAACRGALSGRAVRFARAGLPTWLLAILFAFAFVGVGAGAYFAVQYFRGGTQAASTPVETAAARTQVKPNPLQKYVEISGIRFVETSKHEAEARFVVVNHSGADIADLAGTVNIWGRTAKSEEEAAGSFAFKMESLKPYESKEAVAPLSTKLKPYELPDWQNLSAELQITSPQ
jgi:hypothetical protein